MSGKVPTSLTVTPPKEVFDRINRCRRALSSEVAVNLLIVSAEDVNTERVLNLLYNLASLSVICVHNRKARPKISSDIKESINIELENVGSFHGRD